MRLPIHPLLLPFSHKISWLVSHIFYFPLLCLGSILSLLYGRPLVVAMRPREGAHGYVCSDSIRRHSLPRREQAEPADPAQEGRFVEISGYSFVTWAVISVDDPAVIAHEFKHVEAWLGPFAKHKLAFNLVPLMILGIFICPLIGWGMLSMAFSLAIMLVFSLMAFVKTFH